MTLLFLISLAISFILCISDPHLDMTRIRVFPELNRSIAGVFQVSYVNDLNQVYYAFNASEARSLCLSLALNMASKAQVQKALSRGFETCRFGWTDEHLAVIPRIRPLSNCGQNKSGLVEWRAAVNNKFDVFCFNESDNAAYLDDMMTQRPSESTHSPSGSTLLHLSVSSATSQSLFIPNVDSGAEKALIVGSDQGFTAKKTVLITSAVVISLVAVVAAVYIKLRRRQSGSDKQQHTETEEWTHVKYKGTNKSCSAKVEDISV